MLHLVGGGWKKSGDRLLKVKGQSQSYGSLMYTGTYTYTYIKKSGDRLLKVKGQSQSYGSLM